MKYFALTAAIVSLVPVIMAQSNLQVNTVTTGIQTCEPTDFTWNGGQGPYYVTLVPGGQTNSPPLKNLGQVDGNSLTWNVDLASGTQFTTVVKDSTGEQAFSDQQTVQPGVSDNCVNNNVNEFSGASSMAVSTTGTDASSATTTGGSRTAGSTSATSESIGGGRATFSATTAGNAAATSSTDSGSSVTTSARKAASTSGSSSSAGRTTSLFDAVGLTALMGLVGIALF